MHEDYYANDPLYKEIADEIIWLHASWDSYKRIFAGDKSDVDVLNATSPMAFRLIQDSLRDSVYLGLCRLLDGATTGPKKNPFNNSTLERLFRSLPDPKPEGMDSHLSGMKAHATKIRVHRDKRISHNDYDKIDPLPAVYVAEVDMALAFIAEAMIDVHGHYGWPDRLWTPVDCQSADAIAMWLNKGHEYHELACKVVLGELTAEQVHKHLFESIVPNAAWVYDLKRDDPSEERPQQG